jgi:hypothetical protein
MRIVLGQQRRPPAINPEPATVVPAGTLAIGASSGWAR